MVYKLFIKFKLDQPGQDGKYTYQFHYLNLHDISYIIALNFQSFYILDALRNI